MTMPIHPGKPKRRSPVTSAIYANEPRSKRGGRMRLLDIAENVKEPVPGSLPGERWRWSPPAGIYQKRYRVSNLGRIMTNLTDCGPMSFPLNKDGYQILGIKGLPPTVHRLVAMLFVRNPRKVPYVNHKNGVKHDNRAVNLEWVTPRENCVHAVKIGLVEPPKCGTGEAHHFARLTEERVREIRERHSRGDTVKAMAREYDLGTQTVRSMVKRRTWRHVA